MRFGILTQYYPPEIGAPQVRISELAACITRRGHEVTVLTAMPNYPAGRIHDGYAGLWRREKMAGASIVRTAIYPSGLSACGAWPAMARLSHRRPRLAP